MRASTMRMSIILGRPACCRTGASQQTSTVHSTRGIMWFRAQRPRMLLPATSGERRLDDTSAHPIWHGRSTALFALALAVVASTGCRAPREVEAPPLTDRTDAPERSEDQTAPEPAAQASATGQLHVRSSDFGLDCAGWRASLEARIEAELSPGSSAFVEALALTHALTTFDIDAIPAGARLDHVELELYTTLDEFVVRHDKIPTWLRPHEEITLGFTVDAGVDLQAVLDAIHTVAAAKIGRLELTDDAGRVVARLQLEPHADPLDAGDFRVLVDGAATPSISAQTWPALVEQLAQLQLQRPGVRLELFSQRKLLHSAKPPRPEDVTPSRPLNRAEHELLSDRGVVRLLELTTEGGLDRDTLTRMVQSRLGELHGAYFNCGLRDNSRLSGEVWVDIAIGTRGQVFVAHVVRQSESLPPEFARCFAARFQAWQFARPHSQGVSVVHMSFSMRPK